MTDPEFTGFTYVGEFIATVGGTVSLVIVVATDPTFPAVSETVAVQIGEPSGRVRKSKVVDQTPERHVDESETDPTSTATILPVSLQDPETVTDPELEELTVGTDMVAVGTTVSFVTETDTTLDVAVPSFVRTYSTCEPSESQERFNPNVCVPSETGDDVVEILVHVDPVPSH